MAKVSLTLVLFQTKDVPSLIVPRRLLNQGQTQTRHSELKSTFHKSPIFHFEQKEYIILIPEIREAEIRATTSNHS